MCRLLGFKGSKETKLTPYLLTASNSLYKQALKDARNVSNTEGWGIGFYENGCAFVHKRAQSARVDRQFKLLTNEILTSTMIAHVRQATVGDINDFNAHPFNYGNWVFAHNGTIENFEILKADLRNRIDGYFRDRIKGTSDSETCFYLFLTALKKQTDIYDTNIAAENIIEALTTVIKTIYELSDGMVLKEPHAMNFLVTNGSLLAASRVNNTLYYTSTTRYLHDEVILQQDFPTNTVSLEIDFEEKPNGTPHKNIIIASEPITKIDQWNEVKNFSIIVVDSTLNITLKEIFDCS